MSHRCFSTLVDIPAEGYSARAARQLAGGQRRFPSQLDFNRADVVRFRIDAAEHMSISGVQDKISLKLERGRLLPAERNGQYLLKPVPSADIPYLADDVPANEHLTMQIASQVFGIRTAINACIRFADGEQAYITRRFDRLDDGTRIAQEDFCQLSERTEQSAGKNYKYDASYEEVGRILKRFCGAYPVEIEELFRRIVFNYAFSNGDAHLKNFSLHRSGFGDYLLTPAYDLICTSMHFPTEARTALALFDEFETESFRANGFYKRPDFLKLAEIYGMSASRAAGFLERFASAQESATGMIDRSFLSDAAKADYRKRYRDRLRALAD